MDSTSSFAAAAATSNLLAAYNDVQSAYDGADSMIASALAPALAASGKEMKPKKGKESSRPKFAADVRVSFSVALFAARFNAIRHVALAVPQLSLAGASQASDADALSLSNLSLADFSAEVSFRSQRGVP